MSNQFNNLPKGWERKKLGEVNLKIGDGNYSSKYPRADELLEKGVPFISNKDIKNGQINSTSLRYLSKEKHHELQKGHIKTNDVLVSTRANIGDIALVSSNFDDANINAQLVFLRTDEVVLHSRFLFYQLSSKKYKKIFSNYSSGTAQQQLPIHSLKKIPLQFPKLSEQKAIASVLSSFDNKIELLRQQNETLEKLAQTIFNEWFGKYQVEDKLPKGWKIGKIGDYVKITGGGTPSTKNSDYWNGNIFWSSPKDLSDNDSIYLFNTQKKITEAGLRKVSSGLLPKGSLLFSSRAPIGYLALTEIETAINQGYIAFYPGQYFSNYYMFYWLKTNMNLIKNSANGSTFLEISKKSFKNISCMVPERDSITEFDIKIKQLFNKIKNNSKQIQNLIKTRDLLLPRLMNGAFRVEDL